MVRYPVIDSVVNMRQHITTPTRGCDCFCPIVNWFVVASYLESIGQQCMDPVHLLLSPLPLLRHRAALIPACARASFRVRLAIMLEVKLAVLRQTFLSGIQIVVVVVLFDHSSSDLW